MPRVTFAVCAMAVLIDKFTNMMTPVNVLESIPAPVLPFWMPSATYAAIIRQEEGDPGQFPITLSVRMGAEEVANSEMQVLFEDAPASQIVMVLQGVRVPGAGTLEFHLSTEGRELNLTELLVLDMRQQQAQNQAAPAGAVAPINEVPAPAAPGVIAEQNRR